jgi:protein required for attachment to host cells
MTVTGLKLHAGDWVVVCDGRKSIILENRGDDVFPNLRMKETTEHKSPATHTQGTDAPGRSFASRGGVRSAVEQTDWHDEDERAFLVKLAQRIDAAVTAGEVKRLFIVAPPRALGMIRQHYSPATRKAVVAEVDKDLTKTPIHEIEKHFSAR